MINRKERFVQAIENGFIETVDGYPTETQYAKEGKAEDYTIYGSNTAQAVGDKTGNLFNYTEPLGGAFTADGDGWYDVTIDNTIGTDVEYVNCWTSVSGNLKASTLYYVCAEISEQSGDINYFLTQSSSDDAKGQFLEDLQNVPSGYITTRDDFSDCTTMLKSCCYCEAGKSGHIKFRISVYECLPSEYREVEYIESTGKQYIDTLIDGNDVYGYDIKYQSTGIMTLKSPYLDGIMGINATPIDTKIWFVHPDNASAYTSPCIRSYFTSDTVEQRPVYSLQEYYATIWNVRVDIEKNYTLNGVSMGKLEKSNPAQYDVISIYLFAVNNSGSSGATKALYHSKTRMFHAKFYGETGELIRNFVPCYRVSDSVIGMYDTVEGVFYTNSGTGTFLKGANKTYEFEPYNKYKIPILNNSEIVTNIYLDAPIAQGESVNYKADHLPDIYLKNDINVLMTNTSSAPVNLLMTYTTKVKTVYDSSIWKDVQNIVRRGLASQYFNIGDQLAVEKLSTVTASIGESAGITAVTVDADAFVEGCGEVKSREYLFAYNGESWCKEDGTAVDVSTYGISVTGIPVTGDNIIVTETTTQLVFDVIGIDHDTPADTKYIHSMTLQMHDLWPTSVAFDASEATWYIDETTYPSGLEAGTYYFKLPGGYDTSYGGGSTFNFTIDNAVPVGGQVCFGWNYNVQASDCKITTYSSVGAPTAIETVSVADGEAGISMPSIQRTTSTQNTNCVHRMRFGSNNWAESSLRQWLNTGAEANTWWGPKTVFDRPAPANASVAGFLRGFDPEFLNVVGEVTKTTQQSIAYGYGLKTSSERFFMLSRAEVYGGTERDEDGADGEAYPYYCEGRSDLTSPAMDADANRKKYINGSAQYWWLRTPAATNGGNMRYITTSGSFVTGNAKNSTIYCAPACVIV